MENITLYNGDFLNEINKIEDESVDLILTDIPYNISQKNNLGGFDKKNNRNRVGLDFGEWDYNFKVENLDKNPSPFFNNSSSSVGIGT